MFWLKCLDRKLAHDYSTCGCRCCAILGKLSGFLLRAGTREEVRLFAAPILEAVYTQVLEKALSQPEVAGPPPGTSREASGSGSGAAAPGGAGEASPGKAGAPAPEATRAAESPPPEKEEGGSSSKGRGLPPLARLRKRDRRDGEGSFVETKVKEEQPVDKKEPLEDVEEKRSDKKREKERGHKSRGSKEGREEDRQRKRSRERGRTRRSRSRSRRRDRRRREKTPPKSPSVGADLQQEGGESEAGEPDQDREIAEEETEERPKDRPKPRETEGPPPGFGRGRWSGNSWGDGSKPKKKKSKGKKHVLRNQDYWRSWRERQRGARLWRPRGGQRPRRGGRGS